MTGNSCRDALPCMTMALKLPQYFYLLMEKHLGHYFQVRSVRSQVSGARSRYQLAGVRFQVPEFKFLGVMFQVHIADTNIAKIKIYFYFFRILADRFHPKMSFHHDCMATLIKFGQPEATLLKSHLDIGVLL